MVRVQRIAWLFALVSFLPSCTLAGGFVGSTIPDYRPATVGEARDGALTVGSRVAVVRESDGAEIVGKFRGVDAAGFEVATDDRLVAVDPSDIRSVSVANGTYWFEGAAVGLAADVAFAILLGSTLANRYPDTSAVGNIHVGSDGVTVGAR